MKLSMDDIEKTKVKPQKITQEDIKIFEKMQFDKINNGLVK